MDLDLCRIDVSEYRNFRVLIKVSDRSKPHYIPLIDDRLPGGCGLFRPTQLDLNELVFDHLDLIRKVTGSLLNLVHKANRSIDCVGLILMPLENSVGISLSFTTDKIGEYYYRTYEFDQSGRLMRSYEEPEDHFKSPYMLKLIERWTKDIRKDYRLKTSPKG